MKAQLLAGGLALMMGAGALSAQTSTSPGTAGSSKSGSSVEMSQAECESIWGKIDTSGAGAATQTQAQPYVAGFNTADANGDGRLSTQEFLVACQRGMVRDTASSGASTGTSDGAGTKTGSGSGIK